MTTQTPSADAAGVAPPAVTAIPAAVWGVAAVITFGAFMSGLDTSLVNVGLDTIGRDLHTSLASTQWITSAYLLALAGALPASGWFSRRVGAGRLWLWSLAGFTIASGLCALAPSIDLLVVCRVAQGIAGGLLVSTGITVLADVAGPGRMGRILAITGVPIVLAPALGPTVGALLLAHLSWPWLFVINLPIGAVAVVLGLRYVPRGDRSATTPIDLRGLVAVAAGLPLLTYAITEAAQQQSLTAPGVLGPTPANLPLSCAPEGSCISCRSPITHPPSTPASPGHRSSMPSTTVGRWTLPKTPPTPSPPAKSQPGWSPWPSNTADGLAPVPVEFLSDEVAAAYAAFTGPPTRAELERFFFLDDDDGQRVRKRRVAHTHLGFGVQLGTVRFLGVFLENPADVPAVVAD